MMILKQIQWPAWSPFHNMFLNSLDTRKNKANCEFKPLLFFWYKLIWTVISFIIIYIHKKSHFYI